MYRRREPNGTAMKLIHIIFIINNALRVNGFLPTDQYSSSVEALLNGKSDLCLGDCTGRQGKEECVQDWDGNLAKCTVVTTLDNTPKATKRFRTIHNQFCYSNCGKFNENFDWCATFQNHILDRNYCTRKIALKGFETYKTTDKHLTCVDACTKRPKATHSCRTIVKEQQNCDPMKKVIVFNFLSENGKECVTPCDLHYGIPHCYNTDAEWKKCYLNPDASYELAQISEHMNKTRAAGVYTLQGYKECRSQEKNLVNARPLSVEDVARQYEENFPTVNVRFLDPNNILSTKKDPVVSYTVYNTFSHFGQHQVNLPLVIRAIITNHTILRGVNNDIENQLKEMFPVDFREQYDGTGYFVPTKLGGLNEVYNVFPQTWRNKQGSLAGWEYLVSDIYSFINTQPNSYADYTVVVSYDPNEPNRPHRPTAVGLRVRLFKVSKKGDASKRQLCDINGNPINSNTNPLENMYFSNDPIFNCIFE